MSFGGRLTTIPKEHKISQRELAEMAGIHTNVLGRYEREEATPSVDMAAKIAYVSGLSLDYRLGKTDVELDKTIFDKVVSISKLPHEDKDTSRTHYGLIQHAKTRLAYK